MSAAEIEALFERLSDANPAPTTELEFSTPYELLVAVALSAQATDVSVNKATRRLFPVANTPRAIAKLGVDGISPYIATIRNSPWAKLTMRNTPKISVSPMLIRA